MRALGLSACLVLLLLLPSCRAQDNLTGSSVRTSAADHEADDAARFVAGLPGRPESPYKPLEAGPAWEMHARNMDALWSNYQEGRDSAMRKFAQTELGIGKDRSRAVWYPFSGPDVLTVLALFPGRKLYVMTALEPPGLVPSPKDFPVESLDGKLPGIESALSFLLVKTFFVTREMDRQLRGQVADGVALPILALLARSGHRILHHSYVELDEQGKPIPRLPGPIRAAFGLNRGIEFEIEPAAGGGRARLLYLSLNLDDRHLRSNRAFPAYIASISPTATLVKATSYMPHSPKFARIRSLILDRSTMIVQDDSGIPWRYLDPAAWSVSLFGQYSGPYGRNFQYRDQPELRKAYRSRPESVKPLGFRMGYGSIHVPSNLQIARKRS